MARRLRSSLTAATLVCTGLVAPSLAPSDAWADAWSETFATCKLQTVEGEHLSIEAYACGPDYGNAHLEADDSLPGFVTISDGPDGVSRDAVIRAFKVGEGEGVDGALPAIRTVSPGPHTDSCKLEPAPGGEPGESARFQLAPTGDAKAAWDKAVESGEPIDPPCGPLGVQFTGDLYFVALPDDPTTIAFINAGSEIQIFKPHTLKSK